MHSPSVASTIKYGAVPSVRRSFLNDGHLHRLAGASKLTRASEVLSESIISLRVARSRPTFLEIVNLRSPSRRLCRQAGGHRRNHCVERSAISRRQSAANDLSRSIVKASVVDFARRSARSICSFKYCCRAIAVPSVIQSIRIELERSRAFSPDS
jgi:hypothetical protein